ncbi:MAG: glycosyltransferase [Candidatus Curtissbacteria bacterium]|nr:glycosyltransferase [Candidatus Curtissbacteria bacterium]
MTNKLVSIIIPTYNEELLIATCINSLKNQTYKNVEIILVDDGSTDKTKEIAKSLSTKVITQNHKGPGSARNLGASKAKGKILVFVDADMTFEKDFIEDLISPILKGKTIGTFSKNEFNANQKNVWSACWNLNRGWPKDRLIPPDYPDEAPVYRAILKSEFDKVGGFDATGEYTDDWSLSRKLGKKSTLAKGANYHHSNPSSLKEVWKQARWIGKNEFITGSPIRKIRSLVFYSFPISFVIGSYKSLTHLKFQFIIFRLYYDFAILVSVVKSFLGEKKSK